MNLKSIVAEELSLFLEGKAEDIVAKFPELQPAYDAGIKNHLYLQWIQKRRGGEPVEDIIGVVQAFDKAKGRLKAKGHSPDIYAYKSPSVLRQALEDLGGSKQQERRRLKDEETTYLGTFGDWIVAMPHTRESSCQLGKGTTWCTAATQSQNLFLSYVAKEKENIVLYYLIKKGADPRQDPTAKLSVGFSEGEPNFGGRHGGITVDASNRTLSYGRYQEILKDQAIPALRAMQAHARSIKGKHPAKRQMQQIAKSKDPSVIDKYTRGMKRHDRIKFIEQLLKFELSPEITNYLSGDEHHPRIRGAVAKNPSTPPEVLALLSDDSESFVLRGVARNPSTPPEALAKILDRHTYFLDDVAKNPSTPPEVLVSLSNHKHAYVRQTVAQNPSTPLDVLIKLSRDKDKDVRRKVGSNPSAPLDVLVKLSKERAIAPRAGVAENPSAPLDMLVKLSKDRNSFVRLSVARNPSAPIDVLIKLSKDTKREVKTFAKINPSFIDYIKSQDKTLEERWLKLAGLGNSDPN